MLINNDNFKKCLSRFPTGVTVLTTINTEDNSNIGVTINSLTSVSLNPALILFCLSKDAHTHYVFQKEENFIANILSERQSDISRQFASHISNKWHDIEYSHSHKTNLPIIKGAITYLECKKYASYDGGDHTIFLGQVTNLEILSDDKPLVYYKSNYCKIG